MEQIKKNFGFGMMRLPMIGDDIDMEQTKQMVDAFLEAGFNYFDTAHGYISEKSEIAVRECLTSRHPRESYILTNKLSESYFKKQEDIRPFLESQLEACGVEYFDYYLMHAQCAENYEQYQKCRAYETALELKAEGKIRHLGLSFHDTAEMLDQILTDHPEVEVVQLQINYLDYDDPSVQGRACQEVCIKHGKPIIVMEPVKGGHLVNLPEDAVKIFEELHTASPASYAIRYAAGLENVMMVLSGMSNMEQMQDNISYMKEFEPLKEDEMAAIVRVLGVFRGMNTIPCTACEYCVAGCPKEIAIPKVFALLNSKRIRKDWSVDYYYNSVHTSEGHCASDCIKCRKCEKICPQKLPICELLEEVAKEFEK